MEPKTLKHSYQNSYSTMQDIPHILISLIKNPIALMRTPMRLNWSAILSLQVGCTMVSGALAGMFTKSFIDFVLGLVIFPITSVAASFAFSGFIYLYFSMFVATYLDFRALHSLTVVALVPFFILHTFADFIPPMTLLGFALTTILMIVGLVEQFGLKRKTVTALMCTLAGAFAFVWMAAQIRSTDTTLSGSLRRPSSALDQEAMPDNSHDNLEALGIAPLDPQDMSTDPSLPPEPEVQEPITPENDPNLAL